MKKTLDFMTKKETLLFRLNLLQLNRFLAENSEHIDIGQIQDALQVVMKETNPDKSKDEISKLVYNILKQNISNDSLFLSS